MSLLMSLVVCDGNYNVIACNKLCHALSSIYRHNRQLPHQIEGGTAHERIKTIILIK